MTSTATRLRPLVALFVCALAGALIVVVIVVATGGGSAPRHAAASPATPFAFYTERVPHVSSSLTIYSGQGTVAGAGATPPPDIPPIQASALNGPIAAYRSYSVGQLSRMEGAVVALEGALARGDRAGAEAEWRDAFALYLRLGAVYLEGPIATLNAEIDGTANGLTGGVANPSFAGLHRIEYGLWTGAAPATLVPWARRLDADVRALQRTIPSVAISPLDYATRAHEILEDAVRDLLSGNDVPWSGEGVLGTQAGLYATDEVVATLAPLLDRREAVGHTVDAALANLQSVLTGLARAHGGQLPTNGRLTQSQAELLDGTIGGTLEALAQIPGDLETTVAHAPPAIPAKDEEIDP